MDILCSCIHPYKNTCMCTYLCMYAHTLVDIYLLHIYAHIHRHICIYVCMYSHMCICTYIFWSTRYAATGNDEYHRKKMEWIDFERDTYRTGPLSSTQCSQTDWQSAWMTTRNLSKFLYAWLTNWIITLLNFKFLFGFFFFCFFFSFELIRGFCGRSRYVRWSFFFFFHLFPSDNDTEKDVFCLKRKAGVTKRMIKYTNQLFRYFNINKVEHVTARAGENL